MYLFICVSILWDMYCGFFLLFFPQIYRSPMLCEQASPLPNGPVNDYRKHPRYKKQEQLLGKDKNCTVEKMKIKSQPYLVTSIEFFVIHKTIILVCIT